MGPPPRSRRAEGAATAANLRHGLLFDEADLAREAWNLLPGLAAQRGRIFVSIARQSHRVNEKGFHEANHRALINGDRSLVRLEVEDPVGIGLVEHPPKTEPRKPVPLGGMVVLRVLAQPPSNTASGGYTDVVGTVVAVQDVNAALFSEVCDAGARASQAPAVAQEGEGPPCQSTSARCQKRP